MTPTLIAVALGLQGCVSSEPLREADATGPRLNSDRIAERFGNYGVELVRQSADIRISSLYSGTPPAQTARTIALVRFAGADDPELAGEHDAIVRGGSIGETFRAAGWRIEKRLLATFEVDASGIPAPLSRRLRLDGPRTLGVHHYEFVVARNGRSHRYATISEFHHPDHVTLEDIERAHGRARPSPAQRETIVAALRDAYGETTTHRTRHATDGLLSNR